MASFELYDYDYGERKLSFMAELKKHEFMHVFFLEYNNPGEPPKTIEHSNTFNYNDIVLLRDYLSDSIDLYDQKRKRKEKRKSVDQEKA